MRSVWPWLAKNHTKSEKNEVLDPKIFPIFFQSFQTCSDLLEPARIRSDAFGCVWACSDAFRCFVKISFFFQTGVSINISFFGSRYICAGAGADGRTDENFAFFSIFGGMLCTTAKNRKKCLTKTSHFFRFLAACYAPPPKIKKNA